MEQIKINDEIFKKTKINNYYASENGKVANIRFVDDELEYFKNIKHDISSSGYCRVPLKTEKGVEKKFLVHRLIYETFIGDIPEGYVIDHIDSDSTNNSINNLRVCTQKDNINYAIDKGDFLGNSKFIYIKELETNNILEFKSLKEMNLFLGYGENYTKGMKSTKTKKFREKYEIIDVK